MGENYLEKILEFVDDNIYYADKEYITNSMLGRLNKSPQHLKLYLEGEKESSPALTFGKAFHTVILEPGKVNDDIAIFEGKTRRGKVWDEFLLENSTKTIVSVSEWNTINSMGNTIMNNPDVVEFLNKSDKEIVEIWEDELTGIKCKGKADMVITLESGVKVLVDIKTTADASIEVFRRSSWKYGYDRQAAYYMDGFGAEDFWFVVIEKTAPFRLGIFKAGEEFIAEGRRKNRELLDMYHQYFVAGEKKVNDYHFKGEL